MLLYFNEGPVSFYIPLFIAGIYEREGSGFCPGHLSRILVFGVLLFCGRPSSASSDITISMAVRLATALHRNVWQFFSTACGVHNNGGCLTLNKFRFHRFRLDFLSSQRSGCLCKVGTDGGLHSQLPSSSSRRQRSWTRHRNSGLCRPTPASSSTTAPRS